MKNQDQIKNELKNTDVITPPGQWENPEIYELDVTRTFGGPHSNNDGEGIPTWS